MLSGGFLGNQGRLHVLTETKTSLDFNSLRIASYYCRTSILTPSRFLCHKCFKVEIGSANSPYVVYFLAENR